MRATIHPGLTTTAVTCTGCGTTFELRSSVTDLRVDVCSSCHPAYTGRHERAPGGSQVDRFERRWARGRADRAADRN